MTHRTFGNKNFTHVEFLPLGDPKRIILAPNDPLLHHIRESRFNFSEWTAITVHSLKYNLTINFAVPKYIGFAQIDACI